MMNKIFYFSMVGLLSSTLTLGIYKLYEDKSIATGTKSSENLIPKSTPVKYSPFLSSAGLPDFVEIAENAVNAVVHIRSYANESKQRTYRFDPFSELDFFFGFPNNPRRKQLPEDTEREPAVIAQGSGVIISSEGYIITNNHVIDQADKIMITLNDQKTYKAKIIGADPSTDIALLKIDRGGLPFLSFCDSDQVRVGEWALAIGNPLSLNSTVTAGIISAKNRSLGILSRKNKDTLPIESFIQTDAAINPGNSGGALINIHGQLIGINTAISSRSGAYEGYGFAIPSNLVKKVMEDFKNHGSVQRAYLGIGGMDLSDEKKLSEYNKKENTQIEAQEGILILDFHPDASHSAAAQSGLKKGDIIKEISGIPIVNFAKLSSIIGSKRPGDKVEVKVVRNKKMYSFSVTLRKGETVSYSSDILGASFKPLDKELKKSLHISHGVRVHEIRRGGRLAVTGIEQGDIILFINDKKVETPQDINRILKTIKGTVLLKFIKPDSLNGETNLYIAGFELK